MVKHVGGIMFSLNWGIRPALTSPFRCRGIDGVNTHPALASCRPNFWNEAKKPCALCCFFLTYRVWRWPFLESTSIGNQRAKACPFGNHYYQSNWKGIMQYVLRNKGIAGILLLSLQRVTKVSMLRSAFPSQENIHSHHPIYDTGNVQNALMKEIWNIRSQNYLQ